MLITRPNHDPATNYLYFWSQELIYQAKKRNKKVVDLAKKRANAKEFNSVVKKIQPPLVVFNGHGDDSTVSGYNDEPLVSAGKNEFILKNIIVYARSCRSAKILGPKSIKAGCKTYIGYDDDFVFMTEDDKITQPLKDKTAEIFLKPSNYVVISLLKGHTTGNANERSREIIKQNIQKLILSSATKEDAELIPYLTWNYLHQVCLGNIEATI